MIRKEIHKNTILAWAAVDEVQGFNKYDEEFVRKKQIHHPVKQKQFYAGRQLLRTLTGEDAVIAYDNYGGPVVLNDLMTEVSLSHSAQMVAAARSELPVGIDIQQEDEKFGRVKYRFMSDEELSDCEKAGSEVYTQFCWSAKEAMFKAYRKGNINFKQQLRPNIPVHQVLSDEFQSTGILFLDQNSIEMRLNFFRHGSYTIVSALYNSTK